MFQKLFCPIFWAAKYLLKERIQLRYLQFTANAVLTDQTVCDSNRMLFKVSSFSNDIISSNLWNFGDNNTLVGPIVTHSYSHSGSYKIKLITRTQNGCADTSVLTKSVKLEKSPVVAHTREIQLFVKKVNF